MSDFRTPMGIHPIEAPRDAKDGLKIGNVAPIYGLPKIVNYASDQEVVRRVQEEIVPLVGQCRQDRLGVEEKWKAIRRMTLMIHDDNQKYKGRSNAYLPIHAKNIQAQATALQRGLFPSDEYVEAVAEQPNLDDVALKARHAVQAQLETQAHLRIHMKLFNRQWLDYGFSVLKFWWRKPSPYGKGRGMKGIASLADAAYPAEGFLQDSADQGLTVSARNIFNFYAYPFTAATLNETILQFEDVSMSVAELEYISKLNRWVNPAAIDAAPSPSTLSSDDAERMREAGFSGSTDGGMNGSKLGEIKKVTEVYTFLVLPKAAYTVGDAPDCPLPVRIILLGEEVVSVERNASYHQSSPFLGLSMNANPGIMYGYGPGQMIAPLQYLANDFVNQSNDVCIYGLNPIVKAIPGMVVGRLRPIAPGVTWYVNSQDAIEFMHPPTDQLQWGVQMGNQMMGMAQDFGGAPPAMQGTGAKGTAKTATGAQILQRNSQEPLLDLIEDLSTEVMAPLCSRTWKLLQQYGPEKMMATVFGISQEITKSEMLNEMSFRWLAGLQSSNAQTRAMQTVQFLQAMLPFVPVLQQQGVQLNVLPVLKNMYTQALGYRGWEQLLTPPTPNVAPPPMPGMGGPPSGPPGAPPGAPPGGPPGLPPGMGADAGPRSVAPTGLPPQAGEGDEHMAVRDNSNIISALQGALQGGGEEDL